MSEVVHWFRILSSPQDIESSHEGKCRREGRGGGGKKRNWPYRDVCIYREISLKGFDISGLKKPNVEINCQEVPFKFFHS